MAKRPETKIDSETFEQAMRFCRTHQGCPKCCPLHDECTGAYDMLYKTFDYVKELKVENEKLRMEINKNE